MKKKFVAIMMSAVMAATLLTACGDTPVENEPEVSAPAPAPSSAEVENSEQPVMADPADSNMVSDDTFTIIQQNYAVMLQYHDAIAQAYNSDEIAANPEIESAMNEAADLIVKMGEIQQDALTEEDAIALNDLIIAAVDGLTAIAQAMETTDGAGEAEAAAVSDETFAILQQNWASLTSFYNEAATAYNEGVSNGTLERDESFENLMNQAAEILEQMQTVSQTDITQEQAVELNDTMIAIQEQMAEAMGISLAE